MNWTWFENDFNMIPVRPLHDPNMAMKWSQRDPIMIPAWLQLDPNMTPNVSSDDFQWSHPYLNVIPTWPPNDPTITLTRFQHHPAMIPGWADMSRSAFLMGAFFPTNTCLKKAANVLDSALLAPTTSWHIVWQNTWQTCCTRRHCAQSTQDSTSKFCRYQSTGPL